jgi:phosphoribosyl 1,2-cyclic phosphodiesterase
VSGRIKDQVSGADTLIWESNHDVEMLRMGSYPWNIKRRILGDTGHLSNEDAGEALAEILKGMGENVYLAHLSRDNNLSELAHLTVKNILEEAGLKVGRDINLWPTFDDRPTPIREVKCKIKG